MVQNDDIPARAALVIQSLLCHASEDDRGLNIMNVIHMMAGIAVETALLFEKPDEALQVCLQDVCSAVASDPELGDLDMQTLPPAHTIDAETEKGRRAARILFEDCLHCEYAFQTMITDIFAHMILRFEPDDYHGAQTRAETLRLLIETSLRCMAFEVSAQELCDLVIDTKIGLDGWRVQDCVAGLSALSGVRLGLSTNPDFCMIFDGADIPTHLDDLSYVMTAEAVRLGVPAGSSWRFGLPANDMPADPPYELIEALEPLCTGFFNVINLECEYDQAVGLAKAAGRMLAVAAAGKDPDIEPAIAKPLAMSAFTESYKSVCSDISAMVN